MAPLVVDPCGYLKPHHSVGHCLSLHQTQPRPEQEFVTRDTDNIAALRHCVNSLRHAGLDNQAITAIAGLDTL